MTEQTQVPIQPVQNPDVVLREEDQDGALLFNPDTNQIRVINATGLFVWKLLDDAHDLGAMISRVQESFEAVPQETVEADITQFIDEMTTSGFIIASETSESQTGVA